MNADCIRPVCSDCDESMMMIVNTFIIACLIILRGSCFEQSELGDLGQADNLRGSSRSGSSRILGEFLLADGSKLVRSDHVLRLPGPGVPGVDNCYIMLHFSITFLMAIVIYI